jgi:hydroxyisourate hydrolase
MTTAPGLASNAGDASATLTTHVLDVTVGRPARGLTVELCRLDGPHAGPVVRTETNADGRSDPPLLVDDDLSPGHDELLFSVGDYFARMADADVEAPPIPYLDVVPVRFGVAASTGRLHVALLITPWSYTTYRGS